MYDEKYVQYIMYTATTFRCLNEGWLKHCLSKGPSLVYISVVCFSFPLYRITRTQYACGNMKMFGKIKAKNQGINCTLLHV